MEQRAPDRRAQTPKRIEGGYGRLLQVALDYNRRHPEIDTRVDALLWSINERLGGRPGLEIEPLGTTWLDDLWRLSVEESRRMGRENA